MSVQTLPKSQLLAGGARCSRVALDIDPQTSFDRWAQILREAAAARTSTGWWIADALIFGEIFAADHATDYEAAVEATQLDYQTLRDLKMVAAAFPVSRRRETLTISHHREVVGLDPADQDLWLGRAERLRLSKAALREAISEWRGAGGRDAEAVALVPFSLRTDEGRVERWRAAAAAAGVELRQWVLSVLDQAAA